MTLTPAILSLGYSAERQQLVLKKGGLRVGLSGAERGWESQGRDRLGVQAFGVAAAMDPLSVRDPCCPPLPILVPRLTAHGDSGTV